MASKIFLQKRKEMKVKTSGKKRLRSRLWRDRYVYLLLLSGLLYFLVYKYIPMFGTVIAFKDYSPFLGFVDSLWVGLKHFRTIFADVEVVRLFSVFANRLCLPHSDHPSLDAQ